MKLAKTVRPLINTAQAALSEAATWMSGSPLGDRLEQIENGLYAMLNDEED